MGFENTCLRFSSSFSSRVARVYICCQEISRSRGSARTGFAEGLEYLLFARGKDWDGWPPGGNDMTGEGRGGREGKGGWWDRRQALVHLTVIVLFFFPFFHVLFLLSQTFFSILFFIFLVFVWPQTDILYLHETAS